MSDFAGLDAVISLIKAGGEVAPLVEAVMKAPPKKKLKNDPMASDHQSIEDFLAKPLPPEEHVHDYYKAFGALPLKFKSVEREWEGVVHNTALSPLFEFIPKDVATSTVHEHTTNFERRVTLIKYYGVTAANDEVGTNAPLVKLLGTLDNALFFGNSEENDRAFDGLLKIAKDNERIFGVKSIYTNAEEFEDRLAKNKDFQGLKVFKPSKAASIGEGELPTEGQHTFAVGHDAVKWRQLMPVTEMDLAVQNPFNEMEKLYPGVEKRSMTLIYGCLEVADPEALFIYVK